MPDLVIPPGTGKGKGDAKNGQKSTGRGKGDAKKGQPSGAKGGAGNGKGAPPPPRYDPNATGEDAIKIEGKRLCYPFVHGQCKKGDACPDYHGKPTKAMTEKRKVDEAKIKAAKAAAAATAGGAAPKAKAKGAAKRAKSAGAAPAATE